MSTPRISRSFGSALIVIVALLVPAVKVSAQFPAGTNEIFGTSATVNTPFTRANWSLDPGCTTGYVNSTLGGRGWNGVPLIMLRGGTGTRMVKDLNSGAGSSDFGDISQHGLNVITRLMFAANTNTGASGKELYRAYQVFYPTTKLEMDINPGPASSNPSNFFTTLVPTGAPTGGMLFSADDGANGVELWKAESLAGTTGTPPAFGIPGFFSVQTAMIANINQTAAGASSNPSGFSNAGTTIVFAADNGVAGRELWTTAGTIGGATSLLVDINVTPSSSASSDPQLLTQVGAATTIRTYFTADDGVNGRELWRTDGTGAGTGMLKDIVAGSTGSNSINLASGAGTLVNSLFFTVDSDGAGGQELWKSSGNLDGSDTVMVKDVGGSPGNLKAAGNLMFFILGTGLWKSDGTDPGTVLVQNFTSISGPLVASGTSVYFAADDGGGTGVELWKSDGTATSLVKDINVGAGSSSLANLAAVGSAVYFSANDGSNGQEPWRTDATLGAVLVMNINPGAASSSPARFTHFDGTVVFTADDGTHGTELWQTDGNQTPAVLGVSHKWNLEPVIQSLPNGGGMVAVAGTDQSPFVMGCNILDAPTSGGGDNRLQCKQIAHQFNGLVELTDGAARAPIVITNVDCGDGAGWTRPRAALNGDGQPHNVIAAGMLAILDQDPCDTTSFGAHSATDSPAMPVMHVPVIYDGLNWRPMDLANFPDMKQSIPGTPLVNQMGQVATATPPANMSNDPQQVTVVNPWATKRFMSLRLVVRTSSFDVIWSKRQGEDDGLPADTVWMVTVPRQYNGAFKALHVGTPSCTPTPYEAYFDYLHITGGKFTSSLTVTGACCSPSGCTEVTEASQCSGGTFSAWDVCTGPGAIVCCPKPWPDNDRDGDVDPFDFGAFQACYTGTAGGVPAGCACFNRINDNAIDSLDFDEFVKCDTRSKVPFNLLSPPAGCDTSCPAGAVCPP